MKHDIELRTFEGMTPKDLMVEQAAFNWASRNWSPDNGPDSRTRLDY